MSRRSRCILGRPASIPLKSGRFSPLCFTGEIRSLAWQRPKARRPVKLGNGCRRYWEGATRRRRGDVRNENLADSGLLRLTWSSDGATLPCHEANIAGSWFLRPLREPTAGGQSGVGSCPVLSKRNRTCREGGVGRCGGLSQPDGWPVKLASPALGVLSWGVLVLGIGIG